ncbi:MAG: insulinase family protein [Myxococcota bacterium]
MIGVWLLMGLAAAERPTVDAEIEVRPPVPTVHLLSDGTPVWIVEQDAVPLVRIEVVLRRGYLSAENPAAGMMAGALLVGAPGEALERSGGQMLVGVGAQRSWADVEVLSGFEAEAVGFLAEALGEVRWSRRALRRQRKRWAQARSEMWRGIGRVHNLALSEALYPIGHPLSFRPTASDWRGLRVRDLAAAWSQISTHAAAAILVVGDTSADMMLPLLEATLTGLGGDASPLIIDEPRWPTVSVGDPHVILVDHPGAGRAWITHTRPGPGVGSPNEALAEVVNHVFGGDFSSRLVQRLREADGLVYDIESVLLGWPGTGRIEVTCSVSASDVPAALSALSEEISGMGSRPPSAAELGRARRSLALEAGRSMQRLSTMSAPLNQALAFGQPPDTVARRLAAHRSLEEEAAALLSRALFEGAGGVWVVTGDRAVLEPLMEATGWFPDEIRSGRSVTNGERAEKRSTEGR